MKQPSPMTFQNFACPLCRRRMLTLEVPVAPEQHQAFMITAKHTGARDRSQLTSGPLTVTASPNAACMLSTPAPPPLTKGNSREPCHRQPAYTMSNMGLPMDFEPAPDECGPWGTGDRVMIARHGRQHPAVIRWIDEDCRTVCVRLDETGGFLVTETRAIVG